MKEELKTEIDKTFEKIEEVKDTIEDKSEDFTEKTKELWAHSKKRLSQINEKLKEASKQLAVKTGETNLKAHLAAMEAHSTWTRISTDFEHFAKHTSRKTKSEIDHALLQGHLAKMDAESFMEDKGKTIAHNFTASRDTLEKTTVNSIKEVKTYFEKIAKSLSRED